jgi:hypothetical protein
MSLEHFIDIYINKIRIQMNFSKKGINNRFSVILKEKERDINISTVSIYYKIIKKKREIKRKKI